MGRGLGEGCISPARALRTAPSHQDEVSHDLDLTYGLCPVEVKIMSLVISVGMRQHLLFTQFIVFVTRDIQSAYPPVDTGAVFV